MPKYIKTMEQLIDKLAEDIDDQLDSLQHQKCVQDNYCTDHEKESHSFRLLVRNCSWFKLCDSDLEDVQHCQFGSGLFILGHSTLAGTSRRAQRAAPG